MAWLGVFILCVISVQWSESCPNGCMCEPARPWYCTGTDVDCHYKGLTTVPTNIPNDTCRLDLRGNAITTIGKGSFAGLAKLTSLWLDNNKITMVENGSFNGLTILQKLWLENNEITMIEKGSFEGLTNLETLWLQNNKITMVEKGSFQGLTNLQELRLQNNQITLAEKGSFQGLTNLQRLQLQNNLITMVEKGRFQGFTNLKWLWLQNNKITMIEKGSFVGLTNLEWLRLQNNKITMVEKGSFDGLTELRGLALGGNPLDCGCELVAFLTVARTRKVILDFPLNHIEPSCRTPSKLNGTLLKNLPLQEMIEKCTEISITVTAVHSNAVSTTVAPIAIHTDDAVSTTVAPIAVHTDDAVSTTATLTGTSDSNTCTLVCTKDKSDVQNPVKDFTEATNPGSGIYFKKLFM